MKLRLAKKVVMHSNRYPVHMVQRAARRVVRWLENPRRARRKREERKMMDVLLDLGLRRLESVLAGTPAEAATFYYRRRRLAHA